MRTAPLELRVHATPLPAQVAARFPHVAAGVTLRPDADVDSLRERLRDQLLLVQEDTSGRVLATTRLQIPGALDDLYAAAATAPLGAAVTRDGTRLGLWAPTARNVALCLYGGGHGTAESLTPLHRDTDTGVWSASLPQDLSGRYYAYLVDVHADGVGVVRNRVTDPYAISGGGVPFLQNCRSEGNARTDSETYAIAVFAR